MLQQDLLFEVIPTFHLDRLRWSSGRASRDMPLHMRYVEDIVGLLEPALEVNSIGRLSYVL